MAPEVFRNEEYDTKVDVFSFALILQEVMPLNCLFSFPFVHRCWFKFCAYYAYTGKNIGFSN